MGTFFSAFAQDSLQHCGTPPPTQAEIESSIGYGDNQILIDILRKQGFDIPENYLEMDAEERTKVEQQNYEKQFAEGYAKSSSACGTYYVPVVFWNYYRDTGGFMLSDQQIDRLLFITNQIYKRSNVPIVLYKKHVQPMLPAVVGALPQVIDFAIVQDLMIRYKDPNAYNVHLFARAHANGRAEGIPSQACFIATVQSGLERQLDILTNGNPDDRPNSNHGLLAHELGHCFGLFHTHDCTGLWGSLSTLPNGDPHCTACDQEYVSRSTTQCLPFSGIKCATHGDLLCDTEADPNLSGKVDIDIDTGTYGGIGTDWAGERWKPDARNVMSYTRSWFMERFTPMQGAKMTANLATKTFVSCSAPNPNRVISGRNAFCADAEPQTYSISNDVPANTLIRWTLINPSGFAIQGADWDGSLTTTAQTITVNIAQANSRNAILMASPACVGCTPVCKNLSTSSGVRITSWTNYVYKGNQYSYCATGGKAGYLWTVPSGWTVNNSGNMCIIATVGANAQCGTVEVSAWNNDGCGLSWAHEDVKVDMVCPGNTNNGGCGGMTASNGQPAVTMSLNASNKTLDVKREIDTDIDISIISLIDGQPRYTGKMQMVESIDVSHLPPGGYVARAAPGGGMSDCLTFYHFTLTN